MAKSDYICCDRCDCKIVYDHDDRIMEGLKALGLGDAPILCKDCRTTPAALSSPAPAVADGMPTAQMVTAGAEEVANYYDDGNDLRHREVARFVFQAMRKAAPSASPAQAVQGEALTAILTAARALPSLKGITLSSQDPMAQARWLTALGDLKKAVDACDAALAAARTKEG